MDNKKRLLIKYSLEFIVIVVGISFTFWIDEWNRNRLEKIQHIKDIESIIDDLENDSLIIGKVNVSLDTGRVRSKRLIDLIELRSDKKITYKKFYEGIINVGYVWTYQTFFMTDATYKSLISNGRINLFPQKIHSLMNKYYEATAKRISDHNKIVDDIAIKYYGSYHPFVTLFSYENFNNNIVQDVRLGVRGGGLSFDNLSEKKFNKFFENQDMKKLYSSIHFYSNSINLSNRVGNYTRRIAELDSERGELSKSIHQYLYFLVND